VFAAGTCPVSSRLLHRVDAAVSAALQLPPLGDPALDPSQRAPELWLAVEYIHGLSLSQVMQ
jgi:hypothetical protein